MTTQTSRNDHVSLKLTFCFPLVRLIFILLIKPKIKEERRTYVRIELVWNKNGWSLHLVLLRISIGNPQSLNYLIINNNKKE